MSKIYKAVVNVADKLVPSGLRPLWNHPAGPKTIFFWAPAFKWKTCIRIPVATNVLYKFSDQTTHEGAVEAILKNAVGYEGDYRELYEFNLASRYLEKAYHIAELVTEVRCTVQEDLERKLSIYDVLYRPRDPSHCASYLQKQLG